MYVWYLNLNLGHLSKKNLIDRGISAIQTNQVNGGFMDKHPSFSGRDLLSFTYKEFLSLGVKALVQF